MCEEVGRRVDVVGGAGHGCECVLTVLVFFFCAARTRSMCPSCSAPIVGMRPSVKGVEAV